MEGRSRCRRVGRAAALGLALGLALGAAACGSRGGSEAAEQPPGDDAGDVFTERVVVFITAGPEALDAAREGRTEEEFAVIADDLMWYRAQARELLDEAGIPVHPVVDRRPLRFLVGDSVRTYAFEDQPSLDLLVAYDPGREPLAVAPIGIEQVLEYFQRPPTRSAGLPRDRPAAPATRARSWRPS